MTSAVEHLAWGMGSDASCLKVNESLPKRTLHSAHHVLIEVKAASINPIDYKLARGDFKGMVKGPFPHVVGSDVAGVVVEYGAEVTKLKVGDKVYSDAIGHGPLATICSVPSRLVSKMPSNCDFGECVGLPLAGLTAFQALTAQAPGKTIQGKNVLILGGSGGVGTLAIQLAKHCLGAKYVATTSSNVELCKSLGADEVVNYKTDDLVSMMKDKQIDYIFDAVGGIDYWRQGKQILKSKGKFTTISGDHDISLPRSISRVISRKFKSNFGNCNYHFFLTDANAADLDKLTKFVEDGKLKQVTAEKFEGFTTANVTGIFGKLIAGRSKGKLVIEF